MNTRSIAPRVLGIVAVLALILVAGRATSAVAMVTAPAATTFSDVAGDAGGAPDVTSVVVSDVAATGTITIAVTAPGLAPVSDVHVFIDADKNASTGYAPLGIEYDVYVWQDTDKWGWDVLQWTGSDWTESPTSSAMSFSRSGNTFTWTLGKADLGGSTGFAFFVTGIKWDANGDVAAMDLAPDGGRWMYDLTPVTVKPVQVVKPVIAAPTNAPAVATAGKRFTVSFSVTRSDDGSPMTTGTMICDPSVSGKVIQHAEKFANGVARLSFTIPKTAKGKLLKVKVTIKAGNQASTRITTFKVR
jgi:hypothetical protein